MADISFEQVKTFDTRDLTFTVSGTELRTIPLPKGSLVATSFTVETMVVTMVRRNGGKWTCGRVALRGTSDRDTPVGVVTRTERATGLFPDRYPGWLGQRVFTLLQRENGEL